MTDHEPTTPVSCYDCIHFGPCKWSGRDILPPFKSDAHIRPYLEQTFKAKAEACAAFNPNKDANPA